MFEMAQLLLLLAPVDSVEIFVLLRSYIFFEVSFLVTVDIFWHILASFETLGIKE